MTTINKTFRYDLPDDYLSQERSLGLQAEWTYEGPDKVWVFVDYTTNKILISESFRPYDDENPEKQYEHLEVYTGLNSYPALITYEEDPLLIAAIAQNVPFAAELPQKEYRLPGSTEVFYSRPNPTTPDHTIEMSNIEYDPKLKKWKKPFSWRISHITTDLFVQAHTNILKDIKEIEKRFEENSWSEDKIISWNNYVSEFENVLVKYSDYLNTPWMIPFPTDPRSNPDWLDVDENEDQNLNEPVVSNPNPSIILPSEPEGTVYIEYDPNETDEEAGRLPGQIDLSPLRVKAD